MIYNLFNRAKNIYSSDTLSIEEKYNLIFSQNISKKVFQYFNDLGLPMNYYDPDTSYEDDLAAFMSALDEHMEKLEQNKYLIDDLNI